MTKLGVYWIPVTAGLEPYLLVPIYLVKILRPLQKFADQIRVKPDIRFCWTTRFKFGQFSSDFVVAKPDPVRPISIWPFQSLAKYVLSGSYEAGLQPVAQNYGCAKFRTGRFYDIRWIRFKMKERKRMNESSIYCMSMKYCLITFGHSVFQCILIY